MVVLAGFGCATEESDEDPEPVASAPRLVGRVASMHREEGFALIEGYGDWRLGEGTLLSSVGEGERTGTLVTSGERLGRYHAADLKSGLVAVGDLIYSRPRPREGGEDAAAMPAATGENGGAPRVEAAELNGAAD